MRIQWQCKLKQFVVRFKKDVLLLPEPVEGLNPKFVHSLCGHLA